MTVRTSPRVEQIGDATLILGDCREVLPAVDLVDVVVTDPPYSSGGAMRSDRTLATSDKYRLTGTARTDPDFSGDSRDQRALTLWCSDWMAQCFARTRVGGALLCFIDWRNLPCIIDACQVGGWVYRGIVPWDKTEGRRPNKGWFRAQCEYVVTASAGPLATGPDVQGIAQAGYIRLSGLNEERHHLTAKPVELMLELLRTRADWRTVLDPFMGSASTGVAALRLGKKFVGIECEPRYFDIACKRLEEATRQPKLFAEEEEAQREQLDLMSGGGAHANS